MWYVFEGFSIDISKISAVTQNDDESSITFIMDSGANIVIKVTEVEQDTTPSVLVESFTRRLKELRERDDKRITDRNELLKGILSELKLISQNMRRLS